MRCRGSLAAPGSVTDRDDAAVDCSADSEPRQPRAVTCDAVKDGTSARARRRTRPCTRQKLESRPAFRVFDANWDTENAKDSPAQDLCGQTHNQGGEGQKKRATICGALNESSLEESCPRCMILRSTAAVGMGARYIYRYRQDRYYSRHEGVKEIACCTMRQRGVRLSLVL